MTSNAFQCLLTDDELRASLTAIRTCLRDGGEGATGRKLRMWHEVVSVVADVVTLTETTAEHDNTVIRVDRANLRFLDRPALARFLTEAGFSIEDQYGDWRHGPITETSREIITIARRL